MVARQAKSGAAVLRKQAKSLSAAQLVATLLFALCLVCLLFMLYQLIGGWTYRDSRDQLAEQARTAATTISASMRQTAEAIAAAADSDPLRQALSGDSQRARRRAADGIRTSFSDALRVRVVTPEVERIEPKAFPELGFSALSLMLAAKDTGSAPSPGVAGAQSETPRVNFVAPILEQTDNSLALRGFLLVTRPLAAFDEPLRSINTAEYVDLRSPFQSRSNSIISYGELTTVLDENLALESVPGTNLDVGHYTSPPFAIFDWPQLAVWAGLLAAFGGLAGTFYWRQRPSSDDVWDDTVVGEMRTEVDDQLEETLDFGAQSGATIDEASAEEVPASIFRAYDIRGIIDETLTQGIAKQIGRAIGSEALDREQGQVVVGRDGRLSGPAISEALIEGLRASGVDVIDIGAVPTGVLYFATHALETGSGVMVTGSHNPSNYNGFKIMLGGETLAAEQITALHTRIVDDNLHRGEGGIQEIDLRDEYVERIASDVQVLEPLKVVVDAGNGIAGELAPQVLEEIGCEVIPLHCEVDGNFPNHHPDPSVPENLADLTALVAEMEADLGVAFDGDADRLGVVTAAGENIFADRLLILFARDVLMRNPGANIIFDVKCTGHLASEIVSAGGSPIMWKTGHSLIKAKMKETDAELAGEMSGHFFFKERWFGFDDGIYAAARLLEILGGEPDYAQEMLTSLPNSFSTPELKIEMTEGEHYAFVEAFQQRAEFPDARVNTIDGVRADFDDGWGLVRCSNTTPCLVLRFDADTPEALERIQEAFRLQMMRVRADLQLPF